MHANDGAHPFWGPIVAREELARSAQQYLHALEQLAVSHLAAGVPPEHLERIEPFSLEARIPADHPLRAMKANDHGRHPSALDARATLDPGYAESQRRRKLVEEGFGWGKVVGLLRKLRHRGVGLVDWVFTFTMGIYNLVRMRTLIRVGVCT